MLEIKREDGFVREEIQLGNCQRTGDRNTCIVRNRDPIFSKMLTPALFLQRVA